MYGNELGSPLEEGLEEEFNTTNQGYINPDPFTFAIWGLIYLLLLSYNIYQVMPDSWVPERNNTFFYEEVGWLWSINTGACFFWWLTFLSGEMMGTVASNFFISTMLATALLMSDKAHDADLTLGERIMFSGGMSVYSGWLTSAVILNMQGTLLMSGVADDWNQPLIAVVMPWVAAAIYTGHSFFNADPVYASVFIWALFGIKRSNEDDDGPTSELVLSNV